VHLGAEDGGETFGAKRPRVRDRKLVGRQEMVGQADEVVATLAVAPADLLGTEDTVRRGAVGVQVALVEAAKMD